MYRLRRQPSAASSESEADGAGFRRIRIEQNHDQIVDELSEVYTVRSKIWEAAGMQPMGGCLCIGCLERRLGRMLTARDFLPKHPFNTFPGTERLLARRAAR
ncbi:MAG: hypothetical protein WAN05_31670 [Roseiarcus sp.]